MAAAVLQIDSCEEEEEEEEGDVNRAHLRLCRTRALAHFPTEKIKRERPNRKRMG